MKTEKYSGTFSAATDRFTVTSGSIPNTFISGCKIKFEAGTGGTLPPELAYNVEYFVMNAVDWNFQLSSNGVDVINLTGAGTPTNYCHSLAQFKNIDIYNNIFTCKPVDGAFPNEAALHMQAWGNIYNLKFKNNIVVGFPVAPIMGVGDLAPCDIFQIRNNICFNNGNADAALFTFNFDGVMTNYYEMFTYTDDPDFIGGAPFDYHLDVGSLGLDNGVNVGLLFDYDDNPVADPPDIGIYEN